MIAECFIVQSRSKAIKLCRQSYVVFKNVAQ